MKKKYKRNAKISIGHALKTFYRGSFSTAENVLRNTVFHRGKRVVQNVFREKIVLYKTFSTVENVLYKTFSAVENVRPVFRGGKRVVQNGFHEKKNQKYKKHKNHQKSLFAGDRCYVTRFSGVEKDPL